MLTERPWRPDAVWPLGCGILGGLALGLLLFDPLSLWLKSWSRADVQLIQFLIGTVSFQGVAVGLISQFLREQQLSWSAAFGFKNPPLRRALGLAALAAVVMVFAALELGELMSQVMVRCGLTPEAQMAVQVMQSTVSWKRQAIYAGVTILLVPAAEEMVFRGVLYPTIKQLGYPRLALWGTSLLFGLIHLNLRALVPLSFVAVVLTLLYEETDNLLAPMAAHSLFNAANFVLMFHEGEVVRLLRWYYERI